MSFSGAISASTSRGVKMMSDMGAATVSSTFITDRMKYVFDFFHASGNKYFSTGSTLLFSFASFAFDFLSAICLAPLRKLCVLS